MTDTRLGIGTFITLTPVDSSGPTPGPLAELLYEVAHGNSLFRSVALRCGRAGENGEIVAFLSGERGSLTSVDVIPTQPGGTCQWR